MTYLVAGADQVDAGKTTFSVGLVAHLDTVGFKPRAGNDYWFDHDDVRHAIEDGRLYGKDARRLSAASRRGVDPEDINAVHRLWRPAPDRDGFIGADHRAFVLDRAGGSYVVSGRATMPEVVRSELPLSDAPRVTSVSELNAAIKRRHLPQLRALAERIGRAERPVVESYGSIARPVQGLEPARVAVVEPGRLRVYDGDRYLDACEIATGGPTPDAGALEERVADVVELIEPVATVPLPAVGAEIRSDPDRLARAYNDAYAALV